MKKSNTFYYYLNDFKNVKERMIDLSTDFENFDEYRDIFKALDSCKVSPRKRVVDKVIRFSKLK